MNRDELISQLQTSREAFMAGIEDLPAEAYLESGVMDDWTLKDVLAHLTIWEAQIITLLFRAESSPKPKTVHFGKESIDQLNERWHEQHRDRPLQKVLDDFEGARTQTIRRLESFSNKDLTDPDRFKWLDGRPLWKWIAEETFEHEQDHLKEIHAWKKTRSRS